MEAGQYCNRMFRSSFMGTPVGRGPVRGSSGIRNKRVQGGIELHIGERIGDGAVRGLIEFLLQGVDVNGRGACPSQQERS